MTLQTLESNTKLELPSKCYPFDSTLPSRMFFSKTKRPLSKGPPWLSLVLPQIATLAIGSSEGDSAI